MHTLTNGDRVIIKQKIADLSNFEADIQVNYYGA